MKLFKRQAKGASPKEGKQRKAKQEAAPSKKATEAKVAERSETKPGLFSRFTAGFRRLKERRSEAAEKQRFVKERKAVKELGKKVEQKKVSVKAKGRKKESKKSLTPEQRKQKREEEKQKLRQERATQRSLARELKRKRREARRRKRSATVRKRNLDDYLNKAGYPETNIERMRYRVFFLTLIITAIHWLVVLSLAIINRKTATDILIYSVGLWTALFAFVWLFIWGAIYFFLEMRIYRRTQELEDVLPDFLQLASSNISAGMPIDRALWMAIRPNFGVLANEIEDVAKATISGEDLADSLIHLTKRYDSVTLKRSVAILLEGLDAGGELADLLNKIAINIQELKIMRKEMSANVTTYAIFISFASIFIAPVLFALATQLVQIIIQITSTLDLTGVSASFIPISPSADAGIVADFRWYCLMMLSVTSAMSACIIAVIRYGRVREGVRNIPIFVIVALALYWFASAGLGVIFSSFI